MSREGTIEAVRGGGFFWQDGVAGRSKPRAHKEFSFLNCRGEKS
jgi:hypothetical protein